MAYECEINTVWVRFSNFEPVTFPDLPLFMLVLGREGSSWDEMGMWYDKQELKSHSCTWSRTRIQILSPLMYAEGHIYLVVTLGVHYRPMVLKVPGKLYKMPNIQHTHTNCIQGNIRLRYTVVPGSEYTWKLPFQNVTWFPQLDLRIPGVPESKPIDTPGGKTFFQPWTVG